MNTHADQASFVFEKRCIECNHSFDLMDQTTRCPCGGLLDIVFDPASSTVVGLNVGQLLKTKWRTRRPTAMIDVGHPDQAIFNSGVWRFHELIPAALHTDGSRRFPVVSLNEGNTPLYHGLTETARLAGVDPNNLWVKHLGLNPTGSFKDYGLTVLATWLKRIGAKQVICASTGNTAASTALYAKLAGIEAIVIVTKASTARGKLAKMLAYGATVVEIEGDFDAAYKLAAEVSAKFGLPMSNSLSPWRLLGQQMIAVEICEAFDWDPPDWIILPGGNLGNVSAVYKGLKALQDLGIINKLPKLGVVQAYGAAPFAHAFQSQVDSHVWPELQPVKAATLATAIQIGNPVNYKRACRAITATSGSVVEVTDDEILAAQSVLIRDMGGCEPASAASLAGLRLFCKFWRSKVAPTDRVVLISTGHLLNDPSLLSEPHIPNQTITIAPSLSEFETKVLLKK